MGDDQTLLIAGCGYVGQRVAERWLKLDRPVAAITRSEERAAQLHATGMQPVVLDLAAPRESVQLPVARYVLWAVGFDREADVSRETVWLDGLRWFVSHLSQTPDRFAYVSSTSVYGPGQGETVDERSPTDPTTEGGRCCQQAEQIVREAFADQNSEAARTRATILRLAGIYGPDRLLRKVSDLRAGKPMPGDPDSWLNLIHVDDAVRAIEDVLSQDQPPAVMNVVNSRTTTRRDYYSVLAGLVDAPEPVFGSGADTRRTRGGNKQVVSTVADQLAVSYLYDDVRAGLADAVRRSEGLMEL